VETAETVETVETVDRFATVETPTIRSAERPENPRAGGMRNEEHTPYPLFLEGITGLDSRLRPESPRASGNDDLYTARS